MNKFDIIVVGAGSGGLTAAIGFRKLGKKVLLIEKDKTGGECTHSGCVPSKSLLHQAKTYFNASKISSDLQSLEKYRQNVLDNVRSKVSEIYSEETPTVLEEKGVKVIVAEAKFKSKFSVEVNGVEYFFKKAVIATGSSPRVLDIQGLEEKYLLTNQNIFSLNKIPQRLLVLGSGPIGLELGQAFAMLGTKVTIVTNEAVLLSKSEAGISNVINKIFNEIGVEVLGDSKILEVNGNIAKILQNQESKVFENEFDFVLQAIGRVPNIPEGLDLADVEFDQNGIKIDKNFKTTNRNIFAVGDVSLFDKFTHTADNAARHIISYVLTFGLWPSRTNKLIPKIIYTKPEIGSIGMTLSQVKDMYGNNFLSIEVPFSFNDRAKTDEESEHGLMIVYVKKHTGKILGVNIVGESAGDLIHIFSIAMENNISLWRLHTTIFAYPTYTQLVKKAGDIFLAKESEHFLSYFKNL